MTLVGAALMLVGLVDRGTAEPVDVQVVDLHNDRADQSDDCPSGNSSWHFVVAPNNGSYAFVSISLMLSGTLHTYDSGDLIENGRQRDNVFARVPAGYEIDDLGATGSYAEITPSSASKVIRFVLSSWCPGDSPTSTTSTVVPTSTTSTVAQGGPTTTSTVPSSSTPTSVASTTTSAATTTTVPSGTPPATTGSSNSKTYLLVGSVLLIVGLSLLLGAQRPAIDD